MSDIEASAGPQSEDLYYVLDGNETIGPVPASSVQAMAANGSLRPESSVNKIGESGWVRASQLGFLSGYFVAAPMLVGTQYAGFWLRLAAYIIDTIILNIVIVALSFVLGIVVGMSLTALRSDPDIVKGVSELAGGILGLVVTFVYYAAFLASKWQATPGKRLLGMHVVRTDGRRVGWLLGLGRYLAYIPSSLILGIGFLMIAWADEKKALHDIICSTRVVRGRPGPGNRVVDAF